MDKQDQSRRAIDDIFRLINSGQVQQAETECRSYLDKHPDDINVLGLLGAVCLNLGKLPEARTALEKTIRLEPAFAKPYEDLGMLHLQEEKPQQAVELFQQAIRLDGGQASAYAGLARGLMLLGEKEAAENARQKYLELSPVARSLAQATKLLEDGHAAQAEKICDEISKQNPLNTDALRLLARIATEDGRAVIAEGLLKRIIKVSDKDYRGYVDLGLFLGQQGRIPEAVDALRNAVGLKPDLIAAQQRLGDYLAIMGKPAEAVDVYDTALALDARFVPALVGRGHMLRVLGRYDDAIRSYESGISVRPDFGDAWWSLASLKTYRFSDAQVDEIRTQIDGHSGNADSKICLHFALARACEDSEDFDAAWREYVSGNAQKRANVDYDPVRTEVMHDSVIEVFNRELFDRDWKPAEDGPTPIFIVGMPRSGSTLLEQILASHSQVEGTSELPYMGMLAEALGGRRGGGKQYPAVISEMKAEQLAAFGKSYLYYSREARPENAPFFTDKMPANFAHVGLIHLAMPNAKLIDARRDPLDTCIGNFRQLFAKGKNHSYDLVECAEYYLEYVRIMEHWDSMLPGRVLKVQYEDLVANVEDETRRILEYCELPWEDACLDFHKTQRAVNTASSEQVRMPIYSDAIGYWKNYEPWLEELQDILTPVLEG
jgi:tetratricopeptide (TPR) repeat protein